MVILNTKDFKDYQANHKRKMRGMSFYIMMKGKVVSLAQNKSVTDTCKPTKFYSHLNQVNAVNQCKYELYFTLVYIISSMSEKFKTTSYYTL